MEANVISNISKLFEHSKDIYNDENKLYNIFEEIIINKNINNRYIIDKNKEYNGVKECYYIFLVCFCLCIISNEISLIKSLNLERYEKNKEEKEEINKYMGIFAKINIILKDLNNNLKINLNEISIITYTIFYCYYCFKSYQFLKLYI